MEAPISQKQGLWKREMDKPQRPGREETGNKYLTSFFSCRCSNSTRHQKARELLMWSMWVSLLKQRTEWRTEEKHMEDSHSVK